MSTKGQIVIPEAIRSGFAEGTSFVVSRIQDLVILKQVAGLSDIELEEMKELNKIWNDIDSGKCKSYDSEEFFNEMKKW